MDRRIGIVILVALVALAVPVTASNATVSSDGAAGTSLQADFPGLAVEAGETASFTVRVSNGGDGTGGRLTATGGRGTGGWAYRFMDGEAEATRIDLPAGTARDLRVEVETSGETPEGRYPVRLRAGDGECQVEVTVTRSHAGETGTLRLTAVDEEGGRIRGAAVSFYREGESKPVAELGTAGDGSVGAGLAEGTYRVAVGTNGYVVVERKGIRVHAGGTTDLGTITLEPDEYAAGVEVTAAAATTVGKNPTFGLTIANRGRSDDTYRLIADSMPEGWYVRFRETGARSDDLTEVRVDAGEEATIGVEAIPPYGAVAGEYLLNCSVEGSGGSYPVNMTARLRGSHDLRVEADRYRYDVEKGEMCTIRLALSNTGTAGPLTNLRVNVSTPEGWSVEATPSEIGAIPEGEHRTVELKVAPPSNIVASEYQLAVKVESDQAGQEDEFRVVVREGSMLPLLGLLVIGLIAGGVYVTMRRQRRR
jgi:uncharacterized membrane protein